MKDKVVQAPRNHISSLDRDRPAHPAESNPNLCTGLTRVVETEGSERAVKE